MILIIAKRRMMTENIKVMISEEEVQKELKNWQIKSVRTMREKCTSNLYTKG